MWCSMGKRTLRKVWIPISQVFHMRWVLLHFANLLETDAETNVMKYTRGWRSGGKKEPIVWEKYEHQFPRFYPYNGFSCIFSWYRILMWKPMHFPCNEVYYRMGIGWEKRALTMGKVWIPIFQVLPIVAISKHGFQLKKYEPVALNRVVGALKLEGL